MTSSAGVSLACSDRLRGRMAALTWVLLALALRLPAASCTIIVTERNFELFHEASGVYRATAVSEAFAFEVTGTWWGESRQGIELPWAASRAEDPCTGQLPVKVGGDYLLVLYCADRSQRDQRRVECPAYVEELQEDSPRLIGLEQHVRIDPVQVELRLLEWLDGGTTSGEFHEWLVRMERTALVEEDDWIQMADGDGDLFSFSRSGGALILLVELFGDACEMDRPPSRQSVRAELLPSLRFLLYGPVDADPEALRKLEDLEANLESLCVGESD